MLSYGLPKAHAWIVRLKLELALLAVRFREQRAGCLGVGSPGCQIW